MKDKKSGRSAKSNSKPPLSSNTEGSGEISSKAELKSFLLNVRDKMSDDAAPPIFALGAINYVLNLPNIYELLDGETKEIGRDIWLRLKQCGVQLRKPALLFGDEESSSVSTSGGSAGSGGSSGASP